MVNVLNRRLTRVASLGALLVGCNAILGIEERDLVEGSAASSNGGSESGGKNGTSGSDGTGDVSSGGTGDGAGGDPSSASGSGGAAGSATAGSGQGGTDATAGSDMGGTDSGGTGGSPPGGGSGGSGGSPPESECSKGINAMSSGETHIHTIVVSGFDFETPKASNYISTDTSGHVHYVSLTVDDFNQLLAGQTVNKKSCNGGDHAWSFKCGTPAPEPPVPTDCMSLNCGVSAADTCP